MEILRLPLYIFVVIKEVLIRSNYFKPTDNLVVLLAIILTLIISPFAFAGVGFLFCYHRLIERILRGVYRNNYVRTMTGLEAVFCCCDNCTETAIAFVEFDGSVDELRRKVGQQVDGLVKSKHEKLFYFRDHFCGLHYLYKRDFAVDDLVTVMEKGDEEILSRKQFAEKLSEYDRMPYPKENKMMFHVVIGQERILLDEFPDKKNIYAVVYKIHHVVTDGINLYKLFTSSKMCDVYSNKSKIIFPVPIKNNKTDLLRFLKDVRIKYLVLSITDNNTLRGYNLSEDKNVVWYADPTGEYFNKVRRIKKHFEGSTFLDVINTCVSSSFYDVYEKNGGPIPEVISGGIVLLPDKRSLQDYGTDDFELVNKFTAANITMPIASVVSGDGNKLIARLKYLQKDYQEIRNCFDVQFNYWISQNIFYMVPSSVIKFLSTKIDVTVAVSSFPGCDELRMFGASVREFIFASPNSPGTGFHAVVSTYMGKLKFVLTVDNSILPSHEEAQYVVDRIVYYLDELDNLCDRT